MTPRFRSLVHKALRQHQRALRMLQWARRRLATELPITTGGLTADELRSLVGRPDPVILDIGCNDGSQTLWFLELFPRAVVHAFEPDPRAIARYRAKVHSERAHLHEFAIGRRDGTICFHQSDGAPDAEWRERLPGGWDLSGSIRRPKGHLVSAPWCRFDKTIDVPVRSLDGWANDHGIQQVDFIWADVQGAEIDLIEGGRRTLARTRLLYTEYSNTELYEGQVNLRRLLKKLPWFRLVHRYEHDVLLAHRSHAPGSAPAGRPSPS